MSFWKWEKRMRKLAMASLVGLAAIAAPACAAPPVVAFEVPAEPGIATEVWATGLNKPWGIVWLPDGRALVSEKGGTLRILGRDGKAGQPLAGVPAVGAVGQGGLLDVSLHPDFATNGFVYLAHSVGDSKANRTVLSRGKLQGNALVDVKELMRNPTAKSGGAHFGSRLLWLPDGTLLMSIGDGGNPNIQLDGQPIRNNAQDPKAYFGKLLRMTAEGRPAPGNPTEGKQKGQWDGRVWSIGHRNIQGLALDLKTGGIWATEHGARGGDELNRMVAGGNYGWPLVTHSLEYSGQPITKERSRPGFRDPVSVWTPSIAASGLGVYRGRAIPSLDGAILAGGLMSQDVRVVRIGANGVPLPEKRVVIGARVRDVAVGPDGLVYVLTDEDAGRIIRLKASR
ncbi:PQQ-dependent sugar dehydrogenase [Sandaracinobacter sp. RS1-74]|uniref:PQQ-dependent sugar dehydrogenase n=1 Tax=Sandaracinobacteroides sayramensis TaxID=2913411 RepID=UPI001EDBA6FA|nr:PQQ-dependent sugar dehydrogenase [Sandaracinobacteroides sayramensis]MCG2839450.1 PQQ-dependent sugar dehydrogenase [Sandaracinobacteroides sayramensis]